MHTGWLRKIGSLCRACIKKGMACQRLAVVAVAFLLFTACTVTTQPGAFETATTANPILPVAQFNFTASPTRLEPTGQKASERTSTPQPTRKPSETVQIESTTPAPVHTLGPAATVMINSPTSPPLQVCSPLKGHTWDDLQEIVTNPFEAPPPGKDSGHHGVDFAYYRRGERLSIQGVTIESVLAGQVAAVLENRVPYGNAVIVETPYQDLPDDLIDLLSLKEGDSLYLLYAHMEAAPQVNLDQPVHCGQVLGSVGNTPAGWSSDPHLHLEVRLGPPGVRFTSMRFYDTRATVEEMENYRRWRMSGDFTLVDPLTLLAWGLGEH